MPPIQHTHTNELEPILGVLAIVVVLVSLVGCLVGLFCCLCWKKPNSGIEKSASMSKRGLPQVAASEPLTETAIQLPYVVTPAAPPPKGANVLISPPTTSQLHPVTSMPPSMTSFTSFGSIQYPYTTAGSSAPQTPSKTPYQISLSSYTATPPSYRRQTWAGQTGNTLNLPAPNLTSAYATAAGNKTSDALSLSSPALTSAYTAAVYSSGQQLTTAQVALPKGASFPLPVSSIAAATTTVHAPMASHPVH